jgi:hypothetical protein
LTTYGATYATDLGFPSPVWAALVIIFLVDVFYERGTDVRSAVLGWRLPARIAAYVLVILVIAAAAAYDTTGGGGGFLYANF